MTATLEYVQADWIASLKGQSTVTALLTNGGADEIREMEYQSDKFQYPNIRVGVDFFPSINGCGPDDADVHVDVFSVQKSSKEAAHIVSTIVSLYHKKPFTINGRKYSTVYVRKAERPNESIIINSWLAKIFIHVQVV